MNYRVGSINAGDSVQIIAWAPWLYSIQTKSLIGFVPYRALEVTREMKGIDSLIVNRSAIVEEKINQDRLQRKQQNLKSIADSLVFLDLSVSKKSITEGECFSLDLTFYVSDKNREPYQFYDLGNQLQSQFYPAIRNLGINISNRINEVKGVRTQIKNEYYTAYAIYSGALCPTKTITINSIELKMLHHDKSKKQGAGELRSFFSSPVSITARQLRDDTGVVGPELYKLVGKYKVSESSKQLTVNAGTPLKYFLTIKGTGPTALLPAPWWFDKNLSMELENIQQRDTIINDVLNSSRTFTYQLTFNKAGSYNFSDSLLLSFFDPEANAVKLLKGGPKVIVTPSADKKEALSILPKAKNKFIVLDISQSMLVEDYTPSRLNAALKGLADFFSTRTTCDVGLILFGGNARPYILSKNGVCYSSDILNKINYQMVENGTAIGDALWLAIQSANHSSQQNTIVIIGDGDNTAGMISVKSSISFAKKSNIKIHAVGIGNRGLVPFGRDGKGNSHMVDDTFSDEDFKLITTDSGGKYYWAKDSESISQILMEIFK